MQAQREDLIIVVDEIKGGIAAIGKGAKVIVNNGRSRTQDAEEQQQIEREVLEQSIIELAQSLLKQADALPPRERNPYKNIDNYDISDAGRFYGRQDIRNQLLADMTCADSRCRLAVLHGEVGFGKTSLLRAGVMPALVANEHLPLYVQVTTASLIKTIKQSVLPDFTLTPNLEKSSLQSFFRQVASILGPGKGIFILLDQFEQFFDAPKKERKKFLHELARCLNDPAADTNWLISVRSSRVGYLNIFQQIDRQPFSNTAVLGPLSRSDARQVIEEPARDTELEMEDELSKTLLNDLGGDAIEPASLQIVCHTLVEMLPKGEKRLTLERYIEAGRAGAILRDYLDLIMKHNLKGEDHDKGWRVLEAVDDLGPQEATVERLASRLNAGGISSKEFRRLLSVLEKSYLVRLTGDTYRLTSEKFSPRIREWSAERAAIERARQETIRQLQRIRDSALRGLVAGALGFSLALLITHANKIEQTYLLRYITIVRTVPGGLAGLLLILFIDVGFSSYRYRRQSMIWVVGGLAGAFSFAIAFSFSALLRLGTGLDGMALAALQGALWGAVCGLGIVWAIRAHNYLWPKVLIVILACGLMFWLSDQIGGAFEGPDPAVLAILAGAGLSLFLLAAALLSRRRKDEQRFKI